MKTTLLVAVADITYSVYAWQRNSQLLADLTSKNNQIADLQKQKVAGLGSTSTQTQTTAPPAQHLSQTSSPSVSGGIQFQAVASLADTQVKYYAQTSNDHPPQEYYGFSTARVEALGGGCTTLPLSDIVTLQRFNEKPVATPDGTLLNSSRRVLLRCFRSRCAP